MIKVHRVRRIRRWLYVLEGLVLSGTVCVCLLGVSVHGQTTLRDQGFVPFRDEPINYLSDRINDPVAKLQQRIDQGRVALEFDPKHGYLKSVLKSLEVPVSSRLIRPSGRLSIAPETSVTTSSTRSSRMMASSRSSRLAIT
jgi:hypothetical protein